MAKAIINLQKESGGITKISSADGTGVTELVVPESGNLVSVDTTVTDNAIARYDGTTGKLQNSGVIVDDNGNIGINTTPKTTSNNYSIEIGDSIINAYVGGTNALLLGHNFYREHVSTKFKVGNSYASFMSFSKSGTINIASSQSVGVKDEVIPFVELVQISPSGNLLLTSGTGALGYGAGAGGTVTQLTSKSTAVTLNKPSGRIVMHNAALASGGSVSFTLNNSLLIAGSIVVLSLGLTASYKHSVDVVYSGSCVISIENKSAASRSDALPIVFAIINGSIA